MVVVATRLREDVHSPREARHSPWPGVRGYFAAHGELLRRLHETVLRVAPENGALVLTGRSQSLGE